MYNKNFKKSLISLSLFRYEKKVFFPAWWIRRFVILTLFWETNTCLTKIAFNIYSRGTRDRVAAYLVVRCCTLLCVCACQKWVSEKFENFTGRLLSTGLNHPYDKSCAFRVACTLGFVKNPKNAVLACFQAPNPTSSTRRGGTCTPKNFIFKNHLIYYMKHLPATLYIFWTHAAACTHYLRKNVLF